MPRFVFLTHDHPHPHLDLMLEVEGILWTWRLDREPAGGTDVSALRIGDHRLAYLDYEGPVSGGRGTVARLDRGEYEWVEQSPERIRVRLDGKRCRGSLTLDRVEGENWQARLDAESA